MKNLCLAILFPILILFQSNAQETEQVKIKVVSLGGVSGDLLEISITNNSPEIWYHTLNPFVYYTADHSQSIVFPYGKILKVAGNSEKKFALTGYTLFVDHPPLPAGIEINTPKIFEAAAKVPQRYIEIEQDMDQYKVNELKRVELIPFDFILTKPGTFKLLSITFDPFENTALADHLLIEQVQLLNWAYDRLYHTGSIITHYNNDPLFEKDMMIQHAVWICASGLEGKVLSKKDLRKTLFQFYSEISGNKKMRDFKKYADTYYRILTKLGREAKVFLIPDEVDRDPQCLPANIGFEAISDNVRTPLFDKVRHNEVPIRNQVMLDKRNDIFPCVLSSDIYAALYLTMIPLELSAMVDSAEMQLNKLEQNASAVSNIYGLVVSDLIASVYQIKKMNLTTWLSDQDLTKDERINLVKQDLNYEMGNIKRLLNHFGDSANLAEYERLSDQATYLTNYILDVWKYMYLSPSFDCCELLKAPSPDFLNLSSEYRLFMMDFIKRTNLLLHEQDKLNENIVFITSSLYLQCALLRLYESLTHKKQIICFEGPKPELRVEALNIINNHTGLKLKDIGQFEFKRLSVNINNGKSFDFRFDECFCGKAKETNLPFITLNPGEHSMSYYKALKLVKKYEIGGNYEYLIFSNEGAMRFIGSAMDFIMQPDAEYDSVFKEIYSSKYFFGMPRDMVFSNVNSYSFTLGRSFFNKVQLRFSYANQSTDATGSLPFSYWKDPTDSATNTPLDGYLLSKIDIRTIGLSGRYYVADRISPFTGIGFNALFFRNNFTWAYLDNLEIILTQSTKHRANHFFLETGLRYRVNLDFFLEAGAKAIFRTDTGTDMQQFKAFDWGFFFGAGTTF